MRTWAIIAAILVVVALVAVAMRGCSGGVAVEGAKAQRGPIQEYIDEEAKTRLSDVHLLTMPFNGRIQPIELSEGAPVSKGQVVAQVAPLDLELNVDLANAAVERLKAAVRESEDVSVESTGLKQALSYVESMNRTVESAEEQVKAGQAKANYAERTLTRVRRAAENRARSEEEVDQAVLNQIQANVEYQQNVLLQRAMEALQAATTLLPTAVRQYIQRKTLSTEVLSKQLAEARVQLRQMEKDRQRGTMTSPIDGVILERLHSSEAQVAAGTVLARIGRWEDLEVEADVLSQEVVRIRPGNQVDVMGPAIGSQPAIATVQRIYPAGFTKVSSLGVEQQRVKVIMKFSEQDWARLREQRDLGADYRVRVRIFTQQRADAVTVPRSALFRGPTGDWRLFAIRGGRADLQAVEVGLMNDEQAEIIKGLAEGEEVILAPETNLAEGQKVQVIAREDE
jgi:HlyD family secretion protein